MLATKEKLIYACTLERTRVFDTKGGCPLWVQRVKDGIVLVEPELGFSLKELSKTLEDCLDSSNDFMSEILKYFPACDLEYKKSENPEFVGIICKMNGQRIIVYPEWTAEKIISAFHLKGIY